MRLSDAGLRRRRTKPLYLSHLLPPWLNGDDTPRSLEALVRGLRCIRGNVTRARRPKRLPVVLTLAEVRAVPAQNSTGRRGSSPICATPVGLRLMEALRLRVKDLVLQRSEIIVRDAKGGKDRVTVLPTSILNPLGMHLTKVRHHVHEKSTCRGRGMTSVQSRN
jgi:integrase